VITGKIKIKGTGKIKEAIRARIITKDLGDVPEALLEVTPGDVTNEGEIEDRQIS